MKMSIGDRLEIGADNLKECIKQQWNNLLYEPSRYVIFRRDGGGFWLCDCIDIDRDGKLDQLDSRRAKLILSWDANAVALNFYDMDDVTLGDLDYMVRFYYVCGHNRLSSLYEELVNLFDGVEVESNQEGSGMHSTDSQRLHSLYKAAGEKLYELEQLCANGHTSEDADVIAVCECVNTLKGVARILYGLSPDDFISRVLRINGIKYHFG